MLKIKEIRENKGMTLKALANKSGISERMIYAYQTNENDITLSKLQNIATALDVGILELIDLPIEISKPQDVSNCPELEKQNELLKIRINHLEELLDAKNETIQALRNNALNAGAG